MRLLSVPYLLQSSLSRSSCQFLGLFHSHSHKLLAVLFGVDSLFYYPLISVLCFPILVVVVSFYYFTSLGPCSFCLGLLSLGWCGVEALGREWGEGG